MNTYASKGAAAAAAFAILTGGVTAQAGDLYDAYKIPNNQHDRGIATYNDGLSAKITESYTPRPAVGLAAGDGSLFISSLDGPTNYLERYDMDGVQTDSFALGPLVEAGALTFGDDTLYGAFSTLTLGGDVFQVSSLSTDLDFTDAFNVYLPTMATGLAFGDGSVFIAYDSTLARYDLAGQLLGLHDFGTVSFSALTYGAGQLFAAYDTGAGYGFASVDPLSWLAGGANVATAAKVNGLAFGDGSVFASFDDSLAKYDLDGNELASFDTGRQVNGALAFMSASAAPEPSVWALLILGFGLSGAAIRARRALPAA